MTERLSRADALNRDGLRERETSQEDEVGEQNLSSRVQPWRTPKLTVICQSMQATLLCSPSLAKGHSLRDVTSYSVALTLQITHQIRPTATLQLSSICKTPRPRFICRTQISIRYKADSRSLSERTRGFEDAQETGHDTRHVPHRPARRRSKSLASISKNSN